MKEQYQKEVLQIHVPAELLEKTRQAMKEEQAKQSERKNGKVVPFGKISMVAVAAALLLLVVPVATDLLKEKGVESEPEIKMYLAGQEEIEVQIIEQEKSWFQELVDKIEEFFDL